MRVLALTIFLMPVILFANTTRIACHKSSESFFELEFNESKSGVLLTRELVNRKIVQAAFHVLIQENDQKLILKLEKPEKDFSGLVYVKKPSQPRALILTPIQKMTPKGIEKPVLYGCVLQTKPVP